MPTLNFLYKRIVAFPLKRHEVISLYVFPVYCYRRRASWSGSCQSCTNEV